MKKLAWLVLIGVMVVAACAPAAAPGPKVTVEAVWGRSSPKVADAGAFYMNLKNTGGAADKLIGVKSDACGMAEMHETVDKGGMMQMQPIAGQTIEVAAGATVELKPGGMHIMCMMKKADFKTGDKYAITLTFEKSGEIKVDAEIKDAAM